MSADKAPLAKPAETEAAPAAQESDALALPEKSRKRAINVVIFGIFQAVVQHTIALQSEVALFSQSFNGDQTATARSLATATALSGVLGLFVNQIGGKLSDTLGRQLFFVLGPLVNMAAAAATVRRSKSTAVLIATRVMKSIFTTFSGTVMAQAALADVVTGKEGSVVATKAQLFVGLAVIVGPYIEGFLLKLGKGDPRVPYKALGVLGFLQLVNYLFFFPETLPKSRRASLKSFFASLSSVNPLAFLKVYRGKNTALKKLLTVQTLQYCCDGKVTSDLFQLWAKNTLRWSPTHVRNFVIVWGATVALGAGTLHPYLLKRLSTFCYSTVGNLGVGLGLTMHGVFPVTAGMWGAIPLLVLGVNGANAHAVKSLSQEVAMCEGYGNGEFSGMANNFRALLQSADTVLLGFWYAQCSKMNAFLGSVWYLAGFVGGGLPQLLLMTMPASDFVPPGKPLQNVP